MLRVVRDLMIGIVEEGLGRNKRTCAFLASAFWFFVFLINKITQCVLISLDFFLLPACIILKSQ